jgi:hypothetical protein
VDVRPQYFSCGDFGTLDGDPLQLFIARAFGAIARTYRDFGRFRFKVCANASALRLAKAHDGWRGKNNGIIGRMTGFDAALRDYIYININGLAPE